MTKSRKRTFFRRFLLLFWGAVVIWMFFQMQASGFDDSILETSSTVRVENNSDYIRFTPIPVAEQTVDTLLYPSVIFYPGALVQAESYAPFARDLAEHGFLVIIQKIPFRLAFTQRLEKKVFNRTLDLISESSDSIKWVLAGHSKGGAMASNFTKDYSDHISGLLLIGTSHPRRIDLSQLAIPITKVYGSEDGLASKEEVEEFSKNLPNHTNYVLIEGANHSQFGYYGTQLGSGTATISQEEQQQRLLKSSLELLLKLK
ncbi:MAG: alpha/beta hydrolase [Balneolaceae bacterium]